TYPMEVNCSRWSGPRHLEYAVPLLGRVLHHGPALVDQPGLEGVGAEVLGDDEPGGTAGDQPGQPGQQERVERVLADAYRRVAPYLVELDTVRYVGVYSI